LRLLLELSRPHLQTRPRGLSLESVQRAPREGGQVVLERPAHKLLKVAKKSKHHSAAVEGLPRQDLCVLIWRPEPVIGYLHGCSVITVRTATGG